MEFQNEFDVQAPIDEVYAAMLDLERVTPAMPGAELLEKTDDDHYKVAIKVKVGPISMQYRGDVEVVDKDPAGHRAKLKVQAREARGQGTASADVDMKLDEQGDTTHGAIHAQVKVAGRAAAMGRGVIQDVSSKLVDQFAANLGTMLGNQPGAAAAASANGGAGAPADAPPAAGDDQPTPPREVPAAASSTPSGGAGGGSAAGAAGPSSGESELDGLAVAASVASDRLKDPRILLGSALVLLLIGFLLGRRSAS